MHDARGRDRFVVHAVVDVVTSRTRRASSAPPALTAARQLGHSVQVAEKHYLGLVRGIPRDARTLEAAMQVEDVVAKVIAGAGGAVPTVRAVRPVRATRAT